MKRPAMLAAAGLFAAAPALAQNTGSTLPQGTYETVPLDSFAAPAAPPSVSGGAASLRETHGSWEVRCIAPGDCVMTQLHRRSATSADAVFTVIRPRGLTDDTGNPVLALAEIVVPLGVYLPGGLGIKIDEQPARAAPFERCIEEGCVVRAPLSGGMIEQMKAGSTATLVIFGGPERPVQIPLSLAGFTAAYDSL